MTDDALCWRDPRKLARLPRVRARSLGLIRLVMALGLAGTVAAAGTGCGGDDKKPRRPRSGKKGTRDMEALQQARAAARKGDAERADVLYAAAFSDDKKFNTLAEHVHFLISVHRAPKAVGVAKSYYDNATADTKGIALYAEALIEAGQSREALTVTDELGQLDDESASTHSLRGRALVLANRREEGIDELRRALQIDGKDPDVLMALGEALQKTGKVDEAAIYLRSAVKLDPDNPRAYVLLGAALREQKEIDEAKAALRKAMELDPESGRPYFELGILHNQLAEQADAEQALARAVELDPDDTTYWYAYGEILRLRATQNPKAIDAGKLDLAINSYKRSLDLQPPHPKAAGKLALSLVDANRHDEAEVLLTTMLRADPDNAQSYYFLGAVYAHARKYKLAIDAYEKYLTLSAKTDPERERVKRAILELKRRL
jgi:cytochrome c-type biogenesis protein CcmH/NrfG